MFGLSNVTYCSDSEFNDKDLLERKYLQNTLSELNKILSEFDDYEFTVISSKDKNVTPEIKRKDKKNILIWISDEYGSMPYELSKTFDYIFKSYITEEIDNIYAFPLGYVSEVKEYPYKAIDTRKYNVFFSGNLNSNRGRLYFSLCNRKYKIFPTNINPRYIINRYTRNKILKFKNCFDENFPIPSIVRFTGKFKSGINPEEYSKILSESKIVLCPKGFHSSECFRHYEAMRAGCVIISEKLPETYLYKNSPIIQIENWNDIYSVVDKLLADNTRLKELSLASRKWYDNVLCEKATANHIKEILNQYK